MFHIITTSDLGAEREFGDLRLLFTLRRRLRRVALRLRRRRVVLRLCLFRACGRVGRVVLRLRLSARAGASAARFAFASGASYFAFFFSLRAGASAARFAVASGASYFAFAAAGSYFAFAFSLRAAASAAS